MTSLKNIRNLFGILMLAVWLCCAHANGVIVTKDVSPKAQTCRIEFPSSKRIKAVAIIVHGLNLKPTRMDDWAKVLADHGAVVIRPSLFGHSGVAQEMLAVQADDWRNDINQAVLKAHVIARKHRVPMIFMGYSLGGLVGLEWMSKQKKENIFSKMVLIAPAIAIPWYSSPALKLVDFFDVNFMVMSPCPEAFKANSGSSVNAYRALFSLKTSLENNKYNNANVDTLVLLDQHDELISVDGIKQIVSEYQLGRWQLELVNNDFGRKNHGFRHLMIDPDSVGEEVWKKISERTLTHFNLMNTRAVK